MSVLSKINHAWGRFSSFPANMIDKALLDESSSWLGKLWKGLNIRLMYLFLFVPMLVVDLVVSGVISLRYMLGVLFRADDVQDEYLAHLKQYTNYFSKSLFALLATPIALFEPEAALFFVEENETTLRAGKYYTSNNVQIKRPDTSFALSQVVMGAIREHKKISIVGAGRSQGMQFLPGDAANSLVIDLSLLNHMDEVDVASQTIRVDAGALWKDVQRKVNQHSLALCVMQASNIFSVGGSIGTNIHGWDHHIGVLANVIESIDVLRADASLAINVQPNDDLFKHVVGGFGMHGIVVAATIKLRPNEYLKRTSVLKNPDEYVAYFNQELKHNKDARMHLYRLSLEHGKLLKTGFTETYVVNTPQLGSVQTPNFHAERERGQRHERFVVRLAKRFKPFMSWYWRRERDACQQEEPVLTTNEIMQAPINALFTASISETEWLQEYFIPGENLAQFIDELGDLLMTNQVALLNATVRFVKRYDKNPLSPSYGSDCFAVVICFNQSLQPTHMVQAHFWLRAAHELTDKYKGRVYLPYQHLLSPEMFDASYPQANLTLDYKNQVSDRGYLFSSGFYEKYFVRPHPATNAVAHVRHVMEHDAPRQAFKGFLKHILKRVDAEQLYALLDNILLYKDTHAEIYTELCRRLPRIMPVAVMDGVHQLSSLDAIKGDFTKQARVVLPDDLEVINGLVEVGSPGRYVNGFRGQYRVEGEVIAVHEEQSKLMFECLDSWFYPYDVFVKLNYQALDLSSLDENSADVVTCYVGLHHFTPERLDVFLADVRRILRPNGHFMLVEHDAYKDDVLSMAHMAHLVFNAVNGVPLEDELAEVRNFKPIDDWMKCLQAHGLHDATGVAAVPMVRFGDPTENRMIAFSSTPRPLRALRPVTSSGCASQLSMFREADVPPLIILEGNDSDDEETYDSTDSGYSSEEEGSGCVIA